MRRILAPLFLMVMCPFAAVLAAPGDLDGSFLPAPAGTAFPGVLSAAVLPDGRMFVGGSFLTMNGVSRGYMARINSLGAVDDAVTTFTNDVVQSCILQDDGKLILTGQFTEVNGSPRTYIARLTETGAWDSGFSAFASDEVRTAIPLPDGKVIFGGFFPTINGQPQRFLARVNPSGSLDTTFAPVLDNRVRMILRQPDGRLVIGGDFSQVNGVSRNRIARLNADGTLDATFNPNVGGNGVFCASLQTDGRLVIAGSFTSVGGVARTSVARITAAGALDTGFTPGANGRVRGVCLQTDGRMTFVGEFTQFGGVTRNRIARVLSSGALDPGFSASADALIFGASQQADGKIVVTGQFSFFNGAARSLIGRLENDPAPQSLSVPTPGRIEWLRSGSSPETHDVAFDLSTDGGLTWSSLGSGVRISGGWERTGVLPPVNGLVRARAGVFCGYGNGSRSIHQSTAPFSFTAQQVWRQQYFGTPLASGNAADSADVDSDGNTNLVEFAFGGNPLRPDADAVPQWQTISGQRVLQFTLPPGVTGITCRAERSSSLQPGSWEPISNEATPPSYRFTLPAHDQPRSFLRLQVLVP